MISSGGRAGGSGLLGGGGAGNFADSGGCIGPASCARRETGAAARIKASAPHTARRFDLLFMPSASILWMQSVGIVQHAFVRNPALVFPYPVPVYRGGFLEHRLKPALLSACCYTLYKKLTQRGVSVPRAPDLCYNRAAAKTSRCVKCCRGNAGQAIFRVRQGAGSGVPLFRRANSSKPGCRRVCEKSVRRARGSLCHRKRGADGSAKKRAAARPANGRRGKSGRIHRGNSAGIYKCFYDRKRRINSGASAGR